MRLRYIYLLHLNMTVVLQRARNLYDDGRVPVHRHENRYYPPATRKSASLQVNSKFPHWQVSYFSDDRTISGSHLLYSSCFIQMFWFPTWWILSARWRRGIKPEGRKFASKLSHLQMSCSRLVLGSKLVINLLRWWPLFTKHGRVIESGCDQGK